MPGTHARRSDAEVVAAIRTAVIEELLEVGMGRLTMQSIALRAGVAKTSLYRRWDTPEDVLLDALQAEFPHERSLPTTNNLRHDLLEALRLMVAWMATPTAQATAAILAERSRYPQLAQAIYTHIFEPKGGRFTSTVLQHYADTGEFDPRLLTPTVADIGEAMVLKIAFDSGELPTEQILTDIVDQAILPAVGRPRLLDES
ncbi:TetR/AcrR family transcriptional regulator [Nocardia brasiliensis]|uniref:TetR/AcrR family transcriptional regulator n=1 Tax=Nocardia brasiliensis TaxID=37326 RepID=UPI002458A0C8|nr:TetR/AcrR family transcriptional regulator [Nocardia brasiliensis]